MGIRTQPQWEKLVDKERSKQGEGRGRRKGLIYPGINASMYTHFHSISLKNG
jgi:hypothetical protein